MTIPVWPASLPQYVLVDGFSYKFSDGRLKSPMETGPGKVRRRSSSMGRPFTGQLIVPVNGIRALEDFWDVDTVEGSLPFYIHNQVYLGMLFDENGDPLLPWTTPIRGEKWLARFGDETPNVSRMTGGIEGLFRVSFSLTVLP